MTPSFLIYAFFYFFSCTSPIYSLQVYRVFVSSCHTLTHTHTHTHTHIGGIHPDEELAHCGGLNLYSTQHLRQTDRHPCPTQPLRSTMVFLCFKCTILWQN